jgi:hypothetical protein
MELPEGEYWLIGTLPELQQNSQKIDFCLGSECPVFSETEELPLKQEGCASTSASKFLWWVTLVPVVIRRKM